MEAGAAETALAVDGEAAEPRLGDEEAWHEVVRLMNALADEAVLAQEAAGDGRQAIQAESAPGADIEAGGCPSGIALASSVEGAGGGPRLRLWQRDVPGFDVEGLASAFAKVTSTPPLPVRISKKRAPWQQSGR